MKLKGLLAKIFTQFLKVQMKIITRYIVQKSMSQIVIKKDMIKQLINLAEFGIVPVILSESVTV